MTILFFRAHKNRLTLPIFVRTVIFMTTRTEDSISLNTPATLSDDVDRWNEAHRLALAIGEPLSCVASDAYSALYGVASGKGPGHYFTIAGVESCGSANFANSVEYDGMPCGHCAAEAA